MTSPSDIAGLSERLRATLGGIAREESLGDNLAILLASYFEPHIDDEALDECGNWKQGAIDACDKVLDAIHAHYTTALDSLSARVKEADEACQRLCGAHGFATGHGDSVADMIDEISTQIGPLEERALRAAYERAAKICDAEFDRIISKQTPTDDPLSMADTVNTNIRMMACILPEVAAAIRRLASSPEGGAT